MVQLRGRTKSLFSTMKKLLRLDEFSRGGRDRGEVFDLLGLRVIVSHSGKPSCEEGEAIAAQVSQLASIGHECCHKLEDSLTHVCVGCHQGARQLYRLMGWEVSSCISAGMLQGPPDCTRPVEAPAGQGQGLHSNPKGEWLQVPAQHASGPFLDGRRPTGGQSCVHGLGAGQPCWRAQGGAAIGAANQNST